MLQPDMFESLRLALFSFRSYFLLHGTSTQAFGFTKIVFIINVINNAAIAVQATYWFFILIGVGKLNMSDA